MTVKDFALALWPLVAFVITIVITFILNGRSNRKQDKDSDLLTERIGFLERLITHQMLSAEKTQEKLFAFWDKQWEDIKGKPPEGESKEALEMAAGSALTAVTQATAEPGFNYGNPIVFPQGMYMSKSVASGEKMPRKKTRKQTPKLKKLGEEEQG